MEVSFLLDANIAAPLADKLDKAGHDVERVVDVSQLGEGVDDTTIRLYAVQEGHLIVTSDDDFVQMPADSHGGVFYVPNQSLPSHELYQSIRCYSGGVVGRLKYISNFDRRNLFQKLLKHIYLNILHGQNHSSIGGISRVADCTQGE